ncbi:MAG: hypothetical protein GY928_06185 [Colwellia sp.]|nr:hypothetical protein [Colwellia sp.]
MCSSQIKIQTVKGDFNTVESPEQKVDSIINMIIGDIVSISVEVDLLDRTFPSKISKKIQHNQLKRKRNIVQQYKSYSSHIENAYKIADTNIINGKQSAMILLNGMYIKSLGKYDIDPFEIDMSMVHKNADNIVENVINELKKFVYKSANVPPYKELVEVGINVVVAHAFVECLVLENPNAAD